MENLDAKGWHGAIVGGTTPSQVVARLVKGDMVPWVKPLLKYTKVGEDVLELGSGTGEISAALALSGRQVTLVDFSNDSLLFSQELFRLIGKPVFTSHSDVLKKLPFDDDVFDCTFSSGLLEHFDYTSQVNIVKEAVRVSKGLVMSIVPNAASIPYRLGKWLQEKSGVWKWGKEEPIFSLKSIYAESGIKDVHEFTIEPLHALNFLKPFDFGSFFDAYQVWISTIDPHEVEYLKQGYLLVSVGYI